MKKRKVRYLLTLCFCMMMFVLTACGEKNNDPKDDVKYVHASNGDEYVQIYDEDGEYETYYIKKNNIYFDDTSSVEKYEYDDNWNKTKMTYTYYDASKNVTSKFIYVYDKDGKYERYDIKKNNKYSDGTSEVYEYEYDDNWNKIKETYTKYDVSGNMSTKDICEYEYDTNGNKIEETYSYYDASENITSKFVYVYDEDGKYERYDIKNTDKYSDGTTKMLVESEYDDNWNKTKETYTKYDVSGNIDTKYVNVYDENGKYERYDIKTKNIYSDSPSDAEEYEYDDNWNITKETDIFYDKSGNVDFKYVLTYEYDTNGNKTKYTYTEYDANGDMTSKDIYEYEYDTDENETKRTCTEYDANENMTSKRVSEYDTNGNKTKYTYTEYDANGDMTSKRVSEYDTKGNETKYSYTEYDANGNMTSKRVSEYDTNGNKTKYTYTEYDANGDMTSKDIYEYEYDTDENETKRTCTEYDANENMTSKRVSEYDTNGNEIKSTYTKYDANGNMTSNYIDESEYDTDGNIIKGTTTKYDASGNIGEKYVKVYDEDRRYKVYYIKRTYKYSDGTGCVEEYEYGDNWHPTKKTQAYYDTSGNMTSISVHEYEYDSRGQNEKTTYYDAKRNLLKYSIFDSKGTFTYYDAEGNKITESEFDSIN